MSKSKQRKHPEGLMWLFFTEMWERFGYYLMLGILVLYMKDSIKGGLGFSSKYANEIYGTYIALVYLTPFIGGLLADRLLGYRITVIIGGVLMGLGYCTMALPGETMLFVGLGLVIFGNGFFKPNISTLLGNLYNTDQYRKNKDRGYNIFYMGINIGAFICNFVAAYMRNNYGWGWAFLMAGIGMFVGLAVFIIGMPKFKEGDVRKPPRPGETSPGMVLAQVFIPAIVFALIGFFLPALIGSEYLLISKTTDAFLFGSIPVAFYYYLTWKKASAEDKKPVGALLSIFAVVIVFWMIFHQNGNVLTEWANADTRRELPTGAANFFRPMGFTDDVKSDTAFKYVMKGKKEFVTRANAGTEFSEGALPVKHDMPSFTSFHVYQNDTLMVANISPYLHNLPKEEWPAKGEQLDTANTELFQSINPGFIVLFTPLVLAFFGFLGRKGKEPSTPAKIAFGLLITGLSTLVMVAAVMYSDNGSGKVSAMWLFGTYAIITIGELFLSPMGLSLVSKLSPPHLTAVMMGGWFLSTAIGNKLSGVMGELGSVFEDKRIIFLINLAGACFAAFLLFLMVKKIRAVVRDKLGHD